MDLIDFKSVFDRAVSNHLTIVEKLSELYPNIERLAHLMGTCIARGGKVMWMGNGGSAADSQHLASELVGRFRRERRGLASIALTTDSSVLTSVGNDFSFEYIFARQVEALGRPGDILVGISTSGNSANISAGIQMGRKLGLTTVGLLGGNGGKVAELCDLALIVPANDTPRVQEAHILIGHILCELIEADHDLATTAN